jgi:hypothetical protein
MRVREGKRISDRDKKREVIDLRENRKALGRHLSGRQKKETIR